MRSSVVDVFVRSAFTALVSRAGSDQKSEELARWAAQPVSELPISAPSMAPRAGVAMRAMLRATLRRGFGRARGRGGPTVSVCGSVSVGADARVGLRVCEAGGAWIRITHGVEQ